MSVCSGALAFHDIRDLSFFGRFRLNDRDRVNNQSGLKTSMHRFLQTPSH